MKKLVLIGGGGHCKSVLDSVLRVHEYSEVVITDPELPQGTEVMGCRVVGSDEMLETLYNQGFKYAFVTVGSIKSALLRVTLVKNALKIGFAFPIIADPSSVVSPFSRIGKGTFIGKNAIVNANAVIGEQCIINTGSIIEHECTIGDYTHVSVGAVLCGNVCLGKECFMGAGSTVIQGIKIGNNVIVGANSTVLVNLRDNISVSRFVTNRELQSI